MPNRNVYIPKELHTQMKEFPYINWSLVAQKAIVQTIQLARKLEEDGVYK